jgi:hypothetical protein
MSSSASLERAERASTKNGGTKSLKKAECARRRDGNSEVEALIARVLGDGCPCRRDQIAARHTAGTAGCIGTRRPLSDTVGPFAGSCEPDKDGFTVDGGMNMSGGNALKIIVLDEACYGLIRTHTVFTDTVDRNGSKKHY